jgi:hypothetical protein
MHKKKHVLIKTSPNNMLYILFWIFAAKAHWNIKRVIYLETAKARKETCEAHSFFGYSSEYHAAKIWGLSRT